VNQIDPFTSTLVEGGREPRIGLYFKECRQGLKYGSENSGHRRGIVQLDVPAKPGGGL